MYLWDFELVDEKCGWLIEYEKALKLYPDGKKIEYLDMQGKIRYWYADPVKMYLLMKKTFNEFKSKAIKLYSQRSNTQLNELLPQLVNADICLYNLLQDWYIPEDLTSSIGSFDHFDYFSNKRYRNYNMYFADDGLYTELHQSRIMPLNITYPKNTNFYRPVNLFFEEQT